MRILLLVSSECGFFTFTDRVGYCDERRFKRRVLREKGGSGDVNHCFVYVLNDNPTRETAKVL